MSERLRLSPHWGGCWEWRQRRFSTSFISHRLSSRSVLWPAAPAPWRVTVRQSFLWLSSPGHLVAIASGSGAYAGSPSVQTLSATMWPAAPRMAVHGSGTQPHFHRHTKPVTCLWWGGDGLLYSASQDCNVKVWRAHDSAMLDSSRPWPLGEYHSRQHWLYPVHRGQLRPQRVFIGVKGEGSEPICVGPVP